LDTVAILAEKVRWLSSRDYYPQSRVFIPYIGFKASFNACSCTSYTFKIPSSVLKFPLARFFYALGVVHFWWRWFQGRHQVKKCGMDTHGEFGARCSGVEPTSGSMESGEKLPWSWKPSSFLCPTEAANSPHSPYFANWRIKLQ